jgi:hypothetical protein
MGSSMVGRVQRRPAAQHARVVVIILVATVLGAAMGFAPPAAAVSPEPPYPIASPAPPSGTSNIPYSHTFTASVAGAQWEVASGTLPPGLALDAASGVLSGTPTQAGTWPSITVTAGWPSNVSPGPYADASAGYRHTCGLLAGDASVHCWGSDEDGQSADQVGPFAAVSAGGYHTCGLRTVTGAVHCWGRGGTQDLAGPYSSVSAGGAHTCAILAATGAVDCWGNNDYGQAADQSAAYTALSAGPIHTCAIRTDDHSIDCWGSNFYGESAHHVGPFTAVGAGNDHTCAILTADGTVQCWGRDVSGDTTGQSGAYSDLDASKGYFTCGVRAADGSADCWGANQVGQAEDQSGPYTAVVGGATHACAIVASDGSLRCWGDNTWGQVADASSPILHTSQTFDLTIAAGVAPTLTDMTPRAGVVGGYTVVTLTGHDFTHASGVRFGPTTAAISFTVVNDTKITAVSPPYFPSLVNVWVDTPNGSNANLPVSHFTYQWAPSAAPVVNSVSPNIGPVGGGQTVTILGANFVTASSVSFGPNATSFTIINDAKIIATAPPHAAGLVNLWITNNVGTNPNHASSWYSYRVITGPPPTVSSVSPASGPAAGGTAVTITGTGFTGTIRVDFGTTTATGFVVVDDHTIIVTAPPRPAGIVNVWVRTNNGANTNGASSWYRYT